MPWHVATLIGRKKGRGGERERGRMKKEFKDKRKNYRMRSSRLQKTKPQDDSNI